MFERYDLLIHLCLHLDKHFNGSHMQLYSRADIAHLLAQWGTEIDATELRQRCATYNAEKEVMKVPGMVRVYHLKNDRWYRISISYCSTAT